jgi:two-component system, sensor histidine kinase and response regulator
MTSTPKANIMVIDDQPANLKLLEEMLQRQGYAVRSFPRGRLALAAAAQRPPDLILLDITMPEMSGFEVCERLKSDEKLARIPVIFLSALNEKEDKVRAFQAGGVDYITKPFQFDEVQARVETHLALHRLQAALKEQNEHLEELVRLRTRELADAHQRLKILDRSKNDFLQLISHELRTPLNGVLGVGELLLEESSSSDGDELREMFDSSRRRLLTILDHALLLTQIQIEGEDFVSASVPLAEILSVAVERAAEFARACQVTLTTTPTPAGCVMGDRELLRKAFQALLETAVKLSAVHESVRITCESLSETIRVEITTCGRALPPAIIPKFFDLFSINEVLAPNWDLGLDPPLAYRILALFGGSIAMDNTDSAGTKMTVSLSPCGRP